MATSNFTVKYRPVKIGFLVEQGEMEDILQAIKFNSYLQGGVYNPMIPLPDNSNFAKDLIELFNVDVIYPIRESEKSKKLLDELKFYKHYKGVI